MKKVFLLASLSVFVLASCKKDYTCECTKTGEPTISIPLTKVKKKDADSACTSAGTVYSTAGYACKIK